MILGDLTLAQIALVAATALGAQVIGGLAGYGTGLLMPLVLVPIIGAQAVVPVIGLSAILTNATRVATFRDSLDKRKALLVTATALPMTAVGAWAYSLLSGRGAAILIGIMLIVLVPVRRLFAHLRMRLSDPGLVASGAVYGVLTGGTSGAGVILISLLMGAGLSGTQVIATDAAISFLLGFVKSGTFMATGFLPPKLWLLALLIGVMATPGTMIAKWLSRKFSAQVHDVLLEAAIIAGGLVLLVRNL
jgi:uncharacterized membrane protein YfcA